MIKPDFSKPLPAALGKLHFIGIGGSGMSGIARLALGMGLKVTGSDLRDTENVASLRALGAVIKIGHDALNLGDADTVVVTSALWPTNPELLLAQERGLPILHRSALLAYMGAKAKLIAIAGAHGKTTSTGMVVTGLRNLGQDPSFVNGGVIQEYGVSAGFGSGEHFVIEADESDGSFLHYEARVALITNVDPDHLDHFGSLEAFEQEFAKFAESASELVVISSDDAGAKRVTKLLSHPNILTFGESEEADFRLIEIDASGPEVSFEIHFKDLTHPVVLGLPGKHNALNAAGAIAVLVGLGFSLARSVAAVSGFSGTQRRFQLHAQRRGVSVYDDFAHHPTEVAAALSAARAVVGEGRLITVFQPHLYSRTRIFAQDFADALALSDQVVLLDVYAAREDPEPGVSGLMIAEKFRRPKDIHYLPNWSDVPARAAAIAKSGDFIITMGCGDIYRMVPELIQALEQ